MSDTPCSAEGCTENAWCFDYEGGWCDKHHDEREATRHAEEKRVTAEAGGPWPQNCPRRSESFREAEGEPDAWDIRIQMAGGLRARHCSWCGSLHPDDFLQRVEEGWVVGPTDKSYKLYLEDQQGAQHTKFYTPHLSPEQGDRFRALYEAGKIAIGYPGHFYVRLYVPTAALDEPPREKPGA